MEDKVKKYQSILLAFLQKQASYRVANADLQNQIIADTERNHFQLVRVGWRNDHFVHACPFHFDIKDGKIWIQQNRTDVELGEVLTEMGVPPSDIVIGFLPAEIRATSGYAVA
ncbi:MAG: XisI protein [Saprospiraceae bacterium]